ncbi:MDR family MFS transporter [Bacillus sp. 1P06AnD]|uniref:MDR family MFS transporter n=1 Tax=Bacillus sp. 1P06AnD TaxID=3132208 RepID=UPI0039A179B2
MNWANYPQNIRVRLITSFFNRSLTSAILPFMALYFTGQKGEVWAGTFLALTVFAAIAGSIVGGYLSDRYTRKNVLLVSSSISAAMFLMMTVSLFPVHQWVGLFAFAYVVYIVASGIGRPSMNAIIIDSTTFSNRKEIYAVEYWLTNLSMAIGTALGGLFYSRHQLGLFICLSGIACCLPIAYRIWLQPSLVNTAGRHHRLFLFDVWSNYQAALRDKTFVAAVLGSMCIYSAEFSLNSYIAVRLKAHFKTIHVDGFDLNGVRMLSLLNIENMVIVVLLAFFITKVMNRFNRLNVLRLGLILYSVGYAVAATANHLVLLILVNAVAAIGELMYSPIAEAEKANMMPPDKRGSYSAFAGLGFNGAELIARSSIIIGAYCAPAIMSVYIGGISFIGMGLLLITFRKMAFNRNQPGFYSESTDL